MAPAIEKKSQAIKRGGARPGAGRPKGVPNKITADIKALAQVHAPKAMRELARLAEHAESEAARVAAIKELFDRGFGKASQLVGSDPEHPLPTGMVVHLVKTDAEG